MSGVAFTPTTHGKGANRTRLHYSRIWLTSQAISRPLEYFHSLVVAEYAVAVTEG